MLRADFWVNPKSGFEIAVANQIRKELYLNHSKEVIEPPDCKGMVLKSFYFREKFPGREHLPLRVVCEEKSSGSRLFRFRGGLIKHLR